MTRCPFAVWDPTPVNFDTNSVTRPPQGMVVHTAVGSFVGTENWEHDAKSHVSSYFVVAATGAIAQEVDLDNKAWTQAAGNAAWIGVENEGFPTNALTPEQVRANGRILAWLHETYGVPLQLTTDPINGRGLGYHSMGGVAWSPAHHNCPGPIIVSQLPQIVAAAKLVAPMPTPPPSSGGNPMYAPNQFCSIYTDGQGHVWGLKPTGEVDTLEGGVFYGAYGDLHLPARGDFGHITERPDGRAGYTLWPLGYTNPMEHFDFPVAK